jgi:hypothetical protein
MRVAIAAALLTAAGAVAGERSAQHAGVPEGCAEAVTLFCADPSWPDAQAMERERRPGPPARLEPLAREAEPDRRGD